jgi:DNA-binding MarR family transcriptional regulator
LNNLVRFYSENPNATMIDAGEAVGVARQTVSIYLSELEQAGRVSRNGDGVEVLT